MKKHLHLLIALLFAVGAWAQNNKLENYGTYQQTITGYSPTGAGGWSAPSGVILGGGFHHLTGGPVNASFPGEPSTVYPHYTYGPDEYGWNVYNGGTSGDITIYGLYSGMPEGYGIIKQTISGFSPSGWGGWSVPTGKVILGGGFEANGPVAVSAPAGPNSVWPHYTYGADEYGWVVQSAGATEITVYAIYADEPEGYEIVKSSAQSFSGTGWAGWSVQNNKVVTGGGFELPGQAYASFPGLPGATTPFGYTYSNDEYGWLVQNGGTAGSGYIYVIYANQFFPVEVYRNGNFISGHFSIQAAITAATAGDVIEVAEGSYEFTAQMNIDKDGISIVGQGNVIFEANNASWSTVNGYKHLVGIYAGTETNPVTITNVTMNCNNQNFGLNTYANAYGILNDVTINDGKGAGLTVNGSTIIANDLSTNDNAWGAVNVDPGSGVTDPSVFTLNSGTLAEDWQIWSDGNNVTPTASVTVNAAGYDEYLYSGSKKLWTNRALANVATITKGGETTIYFTIQAAIDAADAGDVIEVAAGTFTENIIIDKQLTINGAGSGDDPASNTIITQTTAGAGDTKVGVVQLTGSGTVTEPILIQNIRLEPDGMAGISVGRFTEATGQDVSYVELDNVHVYGSYHENPCGEQERGLYVDLTSTLSNLTITNSAFNGLDYGWYLQKQVSADASNVTQVTVTGTEFKDNVAKGIYAEKLDNATFTNCNVVDNGDATWGNQCTYFKPWLAGIDINLKAGDYENIAFDGCTFTGNGTGEAKEGTALTIKGRDDGTTYGAFPASLANVTITNCTVTGNERGIRFGEPGKLNQTPSNVSITGSTINSNRKTYTGNDGVAYGDVINQTAHDDQIAIVGDGYVLSGQAIWFVQNSESIQAVINGATAGDVIEVAAGNYDENLTINIGITLLGANANTACDSRGSESVISPSSGLPVSITADGVTLNGFEITGPGYQYAIACSNTSNLNIEYNNIHDIGNSITNTNVHAIVYQLDNGSYTNVNVSDNCLNTISSSGLTNYSAAAIGFLQSASTGVLTNLTIDNNTISNVNVNTGPWPTGKLAYGIIINVGSSGYETTTGKVVNAQVTNNTISDLEGFISTGIGMEGNTENGVVQGNTISNLTGYKLADRSGGGYDLNGIKFETNRFAGGVTVSGNVINANTFVYDGTANLGYAVANYVPASVAGVVDVSCNWFGTDQADEIADNETLTGKILNKDGCETSFLPYWTSTTGPCEGLGPVVVYEGSTATVRSSHMTIQDGVDAATAGDVIEVAAGTYNENVTIDKRVTLNGAGAATTIIQSATASTPVISITGSGTDATNRLIVSNLKITGATGSGNPGSGIYVVDPTNLAGQGYMTFDGLDINGNEGEGLVFNNTFGVTDIVVSNSSLSSNTGSGLRIASAVPTFDGLSVSDCEIENNGGSGFNFNPNSLANVGTNFSFTNTNFNTNNTVGTNHVHDVSMMGFTGSVTFTNVNVDSDNPNYAMVFGSYVNAPFSPAGAIVFNGVNVTGTVGKSGILFFRYTDASSVSLTDLDVKGLTAGWGPQITCSHTTGSLNLGNTSLKTLSTGSTGTVDATTAIFYNPSGTVLNKGVIADNFQIEDQVYHALDATGLGLVTWVADNVYVTENSGSIQRAIDAANDGDVIEVAAGTYAENIIVNKRLTISGADDATVVQGVGGTGNVFTYTAAASGLDATNRGVLQNIKITNGVKGLYVDQLANFIKIDNVTFEGLTSYPMNINNTSGVINDWVINDCEFLSNSGVAIHVAQAANINTVAITNCDFIGNGGSGLNVSQSKANPGGFNNVTISGCNFTNNGITVNNNAGIYAEKLSNAVITGNTFSNNGYQVVGTSLNARAIILNLLYQDYSTVTISDNTISETRGTSTAGYGMFIAGRNDGSYATPPASLNSLTISGNEMDGFSNGIAFERNVDWNSTTVSNNKILNCNTALYGANANSDLTLNVHNNDFTGSTLYHIANGVAGSNINATNNFFNGCPSVVGVVEVYPYYTAVSGTAGSLVFDELDRVDNITANASPLSICFGQSVTLTAGNGSNFAWDNGLGLGATKVVNPTETTTYTVTGDDAGYGCQTTASVEITVNDAFEPTISVVDNGGGSYTLTADQTGTYLWSTGENTQAIDVNPAATTTYSVTVDNGSCVGAASVTIDVVFVSAGPNQTICFNGSAQLNATVQGVAPTTWSWTPETGLSNPTIANPVASPALTTTYTVTVNGQYAASVTIVVNPEVVVDAGDDETIIVGQTIALDGSATGGTPSYSYSWSPDTELSNPNIRNPQASPTVTTVYTLTVTDAFGCVGSDEMTITVNDPPVGGQTVSGNIAYAFGRVNEQMHDVRVKLVGTDDEGEFIGFSALTGDGDYTIQGVPDGTYDVYLYSPVAWGGVTASDISQIAAHYRARRPVLLRGIKRLAADVVGNSTAHTVNVADRNEVNARRRNNISSFATGNFVFTKAADIASTTYPIAYAFTGDTEVTSIQITVNGAPVTQDFRALAFGDVNASYNGLKELELFDPSVVDLTDQDLLGLLVYPNPFSHQTNIEFYQAVEGKTRISLHDMLGNQVRLVEEATIGEGEHTITFNRDGLAPGVYLLMVQINTADEVMLHRSRIIVR